MLLDTIPPYQLPEYDFYTEMNEIPPAVITLTTATTREYPVYPSAGPDIGIFVPANTDLCNRVLTKLLGDDVWLDIPICIRDQRSLTLGVYGSGSELGRVYVDANTVHRTGLPLMYNYALGEQRGETCSIWWSPAIISSLTEFGDITKTDHSDSARVLRSSCSDYILTSSLVGDLSQMTLRVFAPIPVEGEAGRNVYHLSTDGSGQIIPLFTDKQGDGVMSADLKATGGYWLHEETPSWHVAESCAVSLWVGGVEFPWRRPVLAHGKEGTFIVGGSLVVADWQSSVVTVVDDD